MSDLENIKKEIEKLKQQVQELSYKEELIEINNQCNKGQTVKSYYNKLGQLHNLNGPAQIVSYISIGYDFPNNYGSSSNECKVYYFINDKKIDPEEYEQAVELYKESIYHKL